MRTTIDLPDELYRQVKATAAARGLKMKEFVSQSLQNTLNSSGSDTVIPDAIQRQQEAVAKWLKAAEGNRAQTAPVGPFNREEDSTTDMIAKVFFDSNLFLYAYSKDPADRSKKKRVSRHLKEVQGIHYSPQVLQEFISCALRKQHLGITEDDLDRFLELVVDFTPAPLDLKTILWATQLRRTHSFSHWDSTIVAAAHLSGCQILFSEDLQDGFILDHLTIRNPFR